MPQNRIIYNIQDIFVGASRDEYAIILDRQQLLQRLYRIQSFSYDFNSNRTEIKELGSRGTVSRPIISPTELTFSFDYIQSNVANEAKVGLGVNWNTGGIAINTGNNICPVSGFIKDDRGDDARNFYVAINQSGIDAHAIYSKDYSTSEALLDPLAPGYHLISFINSYLTNITYQAAVGDFLTAQMQFVADQAYYHLSGSGVPIYKMDVSGGTGVLSSFKTAIPKHYVDTQPSALRPGDITFTISSTGYGNSIRDLGFHLDDVKIQSYNIQIPLNRDKVEFLGYKSVVDRPLLFPIFVDTSVEMVLGDLQSGDLISLMRRDFDYNLAIKVANPIAGGGGIGQSIALRFDLKKANLESISYDGSITAAKSATMSFRTEINPDDLSGGLFISGIISNLDTFQEKWMTHDGEDVVTDTAETVLAGNILLTPMTF